MKVKLSELVFTIALLPGLPLDWHSTCLTTGVIISFVFMPDLTHNESV